MEAEPLIDHVLDGFHATIFAYGQTGSGKTHTMEGITYVRNGKGAMVPDVENSSSDQHGLLLRSIQLLYDRARARQGGEGTVSDGEEVAKGSTCDEQYTFRCSYLQIYNEKVTDLLNNSTSSKEGRGDGLAIRWCHGDTFKVQNLVKWECESPQSMRDALFRGIKQKVVSSHAMNLQSSRSHCMFTIEVECRNTRTGRVIRTSEFTFVDLAGSEKLGMLAANPSAKMMKESININTSLLALGKVIMALADKKKKRGASHVPYRDSKLTKLLKHSLGGNSFTVMIACINPSDSYIEETTSTLLYAGRAKNIENVPHINEDTNSALIRSLRAEIAQLKKELAYYRSMAAEYVSQTTQDIAPVARSVGEPQTGSATVASSVVPSHKEGQLADSLLTACSMLQQVLEINGKLREAYDAVMEDKEAGEQREVQINAENTALRERVEFLESIALNQNFISKVEQFDEEDDKDTNAESSSEEEEEASSARERPNSTPPVRSTRLAPAPLPPTTGTALFTPSLSGTSARSTAEPVPPLPAATSSRKRKTDKKKSKPKKKKRNLGDKLRDYESRYRGSNVGENYEAYYGDARKSIPKSTKTSNVTKGGGDTTAEAPKRNCE
ncbi:Microtubule binding/Kinesin motor domain containing protein, putative [Angomonas deanei]|uniref:Kinesin-like protein n=1 Tax=Angomonas deanei TaxID=59799 RepID=A0A7G2C605_9TRYP|nr:Microtubule binding/Kinesin motor domain containing protein, putative [Angomonas deanei]